MVITVAVNIVKFLKMLGLPIASAIVLAVLLLESRPLSLDDLRRRTGYAKSHLSSSLRLLEEKLLIERIIGPRRRVLFRVRRDALVRLLHEHLSELREGIVYAINEIRDKEYVRGLEVIEKNIGLFLKKLGEGYGV